MNLLVSVFGHGLGSIMARLTIGLFLLTKFLGVDDTVKASQIVNAEMAEAEADNDQATKSEQ
jgi:hypothetical protein